MAAVITAASFLRAMMAKERYHILYGAEAAAVDQGAVDKIIYPQDTRKYVIGALEALMLP